ncbi:ABC-type Na+ efflux pump permease subunit [Methanofollis sp. W23]|uniref:PrsW family intramembrane metalloprotease n=1 Tax=Methanofollis sp. W23 TaxID=2817849 RepID=UPI001DFF1B15|nr:PrsW family intramembrane metalloprotease [Methanofollis sp. W23]MBP2146273.1 ABC-type Na+ efflux pump permease subunit [Methanofollis sp. W23]
MSKEVLPVTAVLLLALLVATGLTAQSGMHLHDGIYSVATDDDAAAAILASDPSFATTYADLAVILEDPHRYDLIITGGKVWTARTTKGEAALAAFETAYLHYQNAVYGSADDLFAAYPLWIDTIEIESELDFTATESGTSAGMQRGPQIPPFPRGTIEPVPTPAADLDVDEEALRLAAAQGPARTDRVETVLGGDGQEDGPTLGTFKTPSQLSPGLPFDSLVYVFVFIFPLYFTSQFFMMAIANERSGRRGEVLLSTPAGPATIIAGKALPYFLLMLGISAAILLATGGPLTVLLPLVPVILFFLAGALFIGMTARSFRELSFLSIFFSTVMTAYLFFPSVFANVHAVSLISPLTLVVLLFQGNGFGAADYVYATALFYLGTAAVLVLCIKNFNEERLFSQERLTAKVVSFVAGAMARGHPYASLVALNALAIPLVCMVQMMCLALFFNLPLPLALVLLIFLAALTEEVFKSLGIAALFRRAGKAPGWKTLGIAAVATGLGFLLGEKLLLFVTLSQVTGSVFGDVLFSGVGLLWMPFLLHTAGAAIVAAYLKIGGARAYPLGVLTAAAVHALYNFVLIGGAL